MKRSAINFARELDRILDSEVFQRKSSSRKLLRYLADNSFPENRFDMRTANRVAHQFGWEEASAWHSCERLRKELAEFYSSSESGDQRCRIGISSGGRGSQSDHTNWLVELIRGERSAVRRFWRPHLVDPKQLWIVSNAPLFFRAPSATHRIRVMNVNDSGGRAKHQAEGTLPNLEGYEKCYHYVSLGDFQLSLALSQFFGSERRSVEAQVVYASRDSSEALNPTGDLDMRDCSNLIALGNRRVSWVVQELETRLKPNFTIPEGDSNRFHNQKPCRNQHPSEEEWYEDQPAPGGRLHVVVVRRAQGGRTETLICVQNGPALEAMSEILTDDDYLDPILKKAGWQDCELPANFELMFVVTLGAYELALQGETPQLIAWRPISD